MRRSRSAFVLSGRPEPDLRAWECSRDHSWKERHTTYTLYPTCAAISRYVHPAPRRPTMRARSNVRIATTGTSCLGQSIADVRHLYYRLHTRIHVCVATRGCTCVLMWLFGHPLLWHVCFIWSEFVIIYSYNDKLPVTSIFYKCTCPWGCCTFPGSVL